MTPEMSEAIEVPEVDWFNLGWVAARKLLFEEERRAGAGAAGVEGGLGQPQQSEESTQEKRGQKRTRGQAEKYHYQQLEAKSKSGRVPSPKVPLPAAVGSEIPEWQVLEAKPKSCKVRSESSTTTPLGVPKPAIRPAMRKLC